MKPAEILKLCAIAKVEIRWSGIVSVISLPKTTFMVPAPIPRKNLPILKVASCGNIETTDERTASAWEIITVLRRPSGRILPPKKQPTVRPTMPAELMIVL